MAKQGLLYFLDQDIIKIFIPFQIVLLPLGKLRYHFSGHQLRPPRTYNMYIVFSLFCISTLFVYSVAMVYTYNKDFLINYILLTSVYFLIFFLTSSQILFSNKNAKIIKLLFALQNIDRALGLPTCKLYYDYFETRSKLYTASVVSFHLISLVLELLLLERFQTFSFFIILTKLGIDVELVYFLSHLRLVNSRLEFFNNILIKIKLSEGHNSRNNPRDLTMCYRKILRAIKLVNKIWSFQLLVLFAGQFYLISRTMTVMMQHVKNFHMISMQYSLAMNCFFLVRHILIFYLPSICGQELCNLLNHTRVYCGDIVNGPYHGQYQEECRHILSLHQISRPGICILGAEDLKLDGSWPIKVLTAFAACIVVLLQLGFQ